MLIGKMFYPITSLGPGKRLGIWTTGCTRNCAGCSNPELHSFSSRYEIPVDELLRGIDDTAAEGVTVSGGEPFLQAAELKKLVERFVSKGLYDILIFTGFTIEELRAQKNKDIDFILHNIAVLVDGPFENGKTGEFVLRGSSNQTVHILKEPFKDTYNDYLKGERSLNIISTDNGEMHFIGIPPRNYKALYNEYSMAKNKQILLSVKGGRNE